ncbi:thiamine pyrophosphate-binding protein [Verrucomicrobiales bacterium]|nr:thiamine pyrophosphate-binding protein [Verrucomicrobiales bacterium]
MKPGNFARAIVEEIRRAGVTECCVAAGARNAEMLIALAESDICTYRFVDERSAGFFAIGRILAAGKPVAVVTTSGTAVAELLPAVVEAHYQGLPLGVISADRPARFSGSGAPQVIDQPGIFGDYVKAEGDVSCAASVADFSTVIPQDAPWHLNVRFEEPGMEAGATGGHYGTRDGRSSHAVGDFGASGDLVALIGDLPQAKREETAEFVTALGCPVWAEAASGLRERCTTLRGGERALKDGGFTRVLRLGGVPSCRFWRDLEDRPEIAVISVSRTGYSGLARWSVVVSSIGELPELGEFRLSEPQTVFPKAQHPEAEFIHWLSTLPAEGSAIFLGNSLPIREWNAYASWKDRNLRPFANRGANGIDGLLSTFLGISASEPESWAIVGDLSTLYDLGAPWVAPQLDAAKRRIVVINNGGGQIFNTLPALDDAPAEVREMMINPHANQFEAFAKMWGWGYLRVTEMNLPSALPDNVVIEVVVSPEAI